jgi:hypothetical protein
MHPARDTRAVGSSENLLHGRARCRIEADALSPDALHGEAVHCVPGVFDQVARVENIDVEYGSVSSR